MGGDDKDGQNRVWPFWHDFARTLPVPMYKGLRAGHGPVQLTVPLGTMGRLCWVNGDVRFTMPTGVRRA